MITEQEESAGKPTNGEAQLPNGKTMTRDDIIRMAREAGISQSHAEGMADFLERFAALVAAHEEKEFIKMCAELRRMAIAEEREECAKVCEDSVEYAADELARQIRARGAQ